MLFWKQVLGINGVKTEEMSEHLTNCCKIFHLTKLDASTLTRSLTHEPILRGTTEINFERQLMKVDSIKDKRQNNSLKAIPLAYNLTCWFRFHPKSLKGK